MVRVKQESINNLKPIYSTWNNGKTVSIRVPIVIKDTVIRYARYIDKNTTNVKELDNENDKIIELYEYLKSIKELLGKENGYINKNSGRLIRELKDIINK